MALDARGSFVIVSLTVMQPMPELTSYSEYCSCYSMGGVDAIKFIPHVNMTDASEQDFRRFEKVASLHTACCPYCGGGMRRCDMSRSDYEKRILYRCSSCLFWVAEREDYEDQSGGHGYACGIIRSFDAADPQVPIDVLRAECEARPDLLRVITPRALETLVAAVFGDAWGPVEVKHVGQPADGGVDVVMVQQSGATILVQVKRRARPGSSESVRTVRELLGALLEHGAMRGIVVTTADHFSYHAQRLASAPRLRELGYEIDLTDIGILRQLLRENPSHEPWQRYFEIWPPR